MIIQKFVALGYACLLGAAILLAQTSTSEITGTVRDTTGAVVPGSNVTAVNEATGVTYKQTTIPSGLYAFPGACFWKLHCQRRDAGIQDQ